MKDNTRFKDVLTAVTQAQDEDELKFWEAVYVAAVHNGHKNANTTANTAVANRRAFLGTNEDYAL